MPNSSCIWTNKFTQLHHQSSVPGPRFWLRCGAVVHSTSRPRLNIFNFGPRYQIPFSRNAYKSERFPCELVESGARRSSLFGKSNIKTPSKSPNPRFLRRDSAVQQISTSTPYLKQSIADSWSAAVVVAFIAGVVFYSVSPIDVGRPHEEEGHPVVVLSNSRRSPSFEKRHKMTGEALAGRPGTLTPAEDEKLREFWIATLQLFGVLDGQEAKDLNGNLNGHTEPSNGIATVDTKKTKKKRMSLFRSKRKDDDAESTTSTESRAPSASGDSDDKYGQAKDFNDALATLSPESLRATFWSMVKHDHPDALLLRFLRARKWDVEKALVMMVSTMRWRADTMHVDDDIMKNGELAALEDANGSDPAKQKSGGDFLEQMRIGKSFLHGLDKAGRPMCFVRVRLHKQGEQSEESLERYTVFVIESARLLLAPPVDTAVR